MSTQDTDRAADHWNDALKARLDRADAEREARELLIADYRSQEIDRLQRSSETLDEWVEILDEMPADARRRLMSHLRALLVWGHRYGREIARDSAAGIMSYEVALRARTLAEECLEREIREAEEAAAEAKAERLKERRND